MGLGIKLHHHPRSNVLVPCYNKPIMEWMLDGSNTASGVLPPFIGVCFLYFSFFPLPPPLSVVRCQSLVPAAQVSRAEPIDADPRFKLPKREPASWISPSFFLQNLEHCSRGTKSISPFFLPSFCHVFQKAPSMWPV